MAVKFSWPQWIRAIAHLISSLLACILLLEQEYRQNIIGNQNPFVNRLLNIFFLSNDFIHYQSHKIRPRTRIPVFSNQNAIGSVPLMVDADHGYGNALNVRRTVQELENSGAAGLSIEDTNLPRPYDIHRSYPLLSVEEGAAKIQAAVEARKSSSFLIAARTNAPRISSLDDTLKRIESYQKTGVDALFLVGVKTQKQLKTIQEIVKLPIMLGGAGADLADSDILVKHGVRFFVQGHQPIQAAIQTVYSTLKSLREGVKPRDLTGLPDQELIEKVTQKHRYKYLIDRYLEP